MNLDDARSRNLEEILLDKNYLDILQQRKPKEIALKIDANTPSEHFVNILKILENEDITKVIVETNYKKN